MWTKSNAIGDGPPLVSQDSLYIDPELGREFDDALLSARWHLLRGIDERSHERHDSARQELDRAVGQLAQLQDSPYLEALTASLPDSAGTWRDGPMSRDTAAERASKTATAELEHIERSVERAYLSLLPHLERFSPDSPLSILLEGLSAEKIEDLPPDASQIVRIHKLASKCDIPIDANAKVAASIHFFQNRGRETYIAWTRRSGRYRELITRILRAQGLPEDLVYLAMIESGFKPRALSRARARGMWQFIAYTARLEGLHIDHWVDERRDPVKSTHAAARHLKKLHSRFGDWRLAAAAYNAGLGRVSRAMEKADSGDFWKLELPRETRNYIPLFMAATIISKDPAQFGFDPVDLDAPLSYEEVKLPRYSYVQLSTAAKSLGMSYAALRELNPELRRKMTPPGRSYFLRVPKGSGARFRRQLARLPKPEVIEYHVERGDNISTIAKTFGVRSDLIADANSLRNPNLIRPGQKLYIPAAAGTVIASGLSEHTVRRGESLSRIARRHGVTVAKLKALNGLRGDLIRPGQKLRIKPKTVLAVRQRSAPKLQSDEGTTTTHKVQRGDSLWEISRRFDVTVSDLEDWNQLQSSKIFPGQKLVVGHQKADFRLYKVVNGDTLYSIAQRFGVKVEEIARTNNMSSSSTLLAGMTLRIQNLD